MDPLRSPPDILCIGSVLWDVIGRAPAPMRQGNDRPGNITQIPGGVALNIAMTLRRFGHRPALLSAVGTDAAGCALVQALDEMGLITQYLLRDADLPTDKYMAIEAQNGLIAAIADAHSLEAAGARVLAPLQNGTLGTASAPYTGTIALDGNLTLEVLSTIARSAVCAAADLRVAPASPGKAERLAPFMTAGRATLYVNLEEAGLLCARSFTRARDAAHELMARGAMRVLVTDGANEAAEADTTGLRTAIPPSVTQTRVTGAGDTFMAAHISAEHANAAPQDALERALSAAAHYVSGDPPQ